LRSFLRLLAKPVLLARQRLELALSLLRRQARIGQLPLLAAQLLLPPRKLANAIARRLALRFLALFNLRTRFVVRALLALQFLVEERRQILALPPHCTG
jgi:hypothetical protein